MKEIPKVKVRLRGVERGPIEITIMPKMKVVLDEDGITEVDEQIAKKLTGPDYIGTGWELVKEAAPKVRESKLVRQEKAKEVGEFLDSVKG
jgi:hypothetical protein